MIAARSYAAPMRLSRASCLNSASPSASRRAWPRTDYLRSCFAMTMRCTWLVPS